MADFWVNGIVSATDHQPYIQLSNEKGMIAQLSMGQARQIAYDMLIMAARTEMDAMMYRFLHQEIETGEEAAAHMMHMFREYRHEIDQEKIEHSDEPTEEE